MDPERDHPTDPTPEPPISASTSTANGVVDPPTRRRALARRERPVDHHPAAFVDSSAIVALVDRDDTTHAAAVEAYQGLVAAGYKLVTTNHVVAETFDLLNAGLGTSVARQWLRDAKLAVYHPDEADETKARKLILGADSRRQLSYTDAVSLVVMERLGITDAFAIDPNFLAETA